MFVFFPSFTKQKKKLKEIGLKSKWNTHIKHMVVSTAKQPSENVIFFQILMPHLHEQSIRIRKVWKILKLKKKVKSLIF
jgi:hypothetical protein